MHYLIQLLMAYLGSLGFGILYNLRGKQLLFASLGGLLSWVVYLLVNQFTDSPYPCAFFASVAIALFSELIARIIKTPITGLLGAAVIPLIPGAGLYRAVSALMLRDAELAASHGTYTLLFAASMAAGITLTTLIFRMVINIARERRCSKA